MPPPQGTPNFLEGPGDYSVTTKVHSDTYPAIDPSKLDPSLLKGRAVYICGASRGIGRAIATSFARGGASLIAIGARATTSLEPVAEQLRAAAREAGRATPRVVCVALDASSPPSVAAAAETVRRECEGAGLGGLDAIVQNAAIFGEPARIADADPDDWWRVYEVNVRGQFLAARYFVPLLLAGGPRPGEGEGKGEGGLRTFVTVASVGAHIVGEAYSSYQSSKLANLRIAEFVDREHGRDGVSAWCVHPGNVLTDMAGGPDGEIAQTMGEIFVDTPEISADTIVYLTAEKRQWLSGRYINCTWDMPELLAQEEEIVKGDKLKVRLVL